METEIDLLVSLERGEVTSQSSLASRVAVSVGLLNALLKRASEKGYVKIRKAPYRRYAYYLTPRGFSEKSRLVAKYLETSLDFFREARLGYVAAFSRAQAAGSRRAVLVGRGELAEIALIAARETGFEVVALFDRAANAEEVHGLPVIRDWEACDGVDVVVLTESRKPQRAFDDLRGRWDDSRILTPPFLRVSREAPQFDAAADREGVPPVP